MKKLILHAGFPKCGSTSIFENLRANASSLQSQNVFVLGKDFKIPDGNGSLESLVWTFRSAENDLEISNSIRKRVLEALERVPNSGSVLISAENLSHVRLTGLFEGFDSKFKVHYISYIRPQASWIPSAWKQWDMKEGITVSQTLAKCLRKKRPNYLGFAKAVREKLPRAKIDIRIFNRDYLFGGDLVSDFFNTAEIDASGLSLKEIVANPSIDYSILFAMMKNSKSLFKGRHDNTFIREIIQRLPSAYMKPNIEFLSDEEKGCAYSHFFSDNLELIRDFSLPQEPYTDELVWKIFRIKGKGPTLSDFSEREILMRARCILDECKPSRGINNSVEKLGGLIAGSIP